MDGPCYNCPERRVGCHSGCERYQAWRQGYDAEQEAKRREKQQRVGVEDIMIRKALQSKRKWRHS